MLPPLEDILANHAHIHQAEGFFYRDIFIEACSAPCQVIPASLLDPALAPSSALQPWGRDQKLAALAAKLILSQ
jgi:hypothetical protein